MTHNFYNIGKNYILTGNEINIELLKYENILEFLRGYIELNYDIELPINSNDNKDKPILYIYFKNKDLELLNKIYEYIKTKLNIKCKYFLKKKNHNKIRYNFILLFKGNNVLNLLSKIYYLNINKSEIDDYLYNIYMNLSAYRYITFDSDTDTLNYLLPKCYVKLLNPYAIMPTKNYASDIGYDISIIKRYKNISNNIIIYDTGIQFIPTFGYYFKLIPTFNLSLYGYIIGNTTGIIETINNTKKNKTLLISLIKIDKEMPDLILPFKCCNLLLKEILHYELEQIN